MSRRIRTHIVMTSAENYIAAIHCNANPTAWGDKMCKRFRPGDLLVIQTMFASSAISAPLQTARAIDRVEHGSGRGYALVWLSKLPDDQVPA